MAKEKMALETILVGSNHGLRVLLQWRDDYGSSGPAGITWGSLQLWIGSTLIWGEFDNKGQPIGIRWNWIDLLEFLAVAWPYLNEEESYPLNFGEGLEAPAHAGELRGKARLRWLNFSDPEIQQEDNLLRDFLSVHDLAEALHGSTPPSLVLLRQGNCMSAALPTREWLLSYSETMETLTKLAESILERITSLDDVRTLTACQRWRERDNAIPELEKLHVATGLDTGILRKVWPFNPEDKAANDEAYDLKAAARMVKGQLDQDALRSMLEIIERIPKGRRLRLDDEWGLAKHTLEEHSNDRPSVQGYALAQMLREHLGIDDGVVDPECLLRDWGVVLTEVNIENPVIDAIAIWSRRHGPTIMLNRNGPRSKYPTGRRTTCAHEICHLLVDIDAGLPVAEVLGGSVQKLLEQRANAFAAEFLLPQALAGTYVASSLEYVHSLEDRQGQVKRAVDDLAKKFNVSHETTAWQIRNSGRLDEPDIVVLTPCFQSINNPIVQ